MSRVIPRFKSCAVLLCAGLVCASLLLSCQTAENSESKSEILALPDLGIRYTPPAGMIDKTSSESREARTRAASYSRKAAELLLDLSSPGDDTSPDWHQVWVFIYPRSYLSNLNDPAAELKMNTALAGPHAKSVGQPQSAVVAGRGFLASEFEVSEPPLLKHAKIYTTICKTQLVSFAFVSNAAEQVKAMESSLKTLQFSSR